MCHGPASTSVLGLKADRQVASPPRRASRGFTLIELMVAVAVVAILAGIAVPAMRSYIQDERQFTHAQSLWMALNVARSESRKRDVSVNVCPSTNGTSCNAPATAWAQGWIVLSTAPGATPSMVSGPIASGSTLTETTALPSVTFFSNGMVSTAAAFTFCDSRGAAKARSVEVTLAGRVSSAAAVGKRLNGAVLACP